MPTPTLPAASRLSAAQAEAAELLGEWARANEKFRALAARDAPAAVATTVPSATPQAPKPRGPKAKR